MIFDYDEVEPLDRYKLMSQTVTPRAIAWIVTEDINSGVVNLAPFSYFTPLSSNPPTLIVSIGHRKDGTEKDTLRNIRESKKCTICIPNRDSLQPLHLTGKPLDKSESEIEKFNIRTVSLFEDFPDVVDGVSVAFGCEFFKEVDLEGSKTIPLILKIKKQFVADEVIESFEDLKIKHKSLGRDGNGYIIDFTKVDAPT